MIAKTRQQGGSSGFQTTDLESSNAEHSALDVRDLREKDVGKKHSVVPDLKDLNKSELVPNPKFPEKTKVPQGLVGSRGGLLTKKSTNALMPKRDSQKDVRAVERRNKGVEKKVPNKVSIKEEENQNSEDFTDGRDPGEKKKEEEEQERSDRFYQLNKRLRQGNLKREKVQGIQKTDSEYSSSLSSTISSTLISSNLNGTISTATSSTYATTSSINNSTNQEERAKQKNSLGIMPNKTKQESKGEEESSDIIGDQDDSLPCPEIPPGLQVRFVYKRQKCLIWVPCENSVDHQYEQS